MLLQRLDNLLTLALPDDLLWTDEHQWTATVAKTEYLLTGSLLVESALRLSGRPITLKASSDMAWVTRGLVDQLYAWAHVLTPSGPLRMRLVFEPGSSRERSFVVAFRLGEGASEAAGGGAIEAEPVLGLPARSSLAWYRLSLRLLEI